MRLRHPMAGRGFALRFFVIGNPSKSLHLADSQNGLDAKNKLLMTILCGKLSTNFPAKSPF